MNFSEDTLTGYPQDLVAFYVNKYKQQKTINLKAREQNESRDLPSANSA